MPDGGKGVSGGVKGCQGVSGGVKPLTNINLSPHYPTTFHLPLPHFQEIYCEK